MLRARLDQLSSRLAALSPLTVLARGYSITLDEHGRAVTRAGSVSVGASVTLRLHEGALAARVVDRSVDESGSPCDSEAEA